MRLPILLLLASAVLAAPAAAQSSPPAGEFAAETATTGTPIEPTTAPATPEITRLQREVRDLRAEINHLRSSLTSVENKARNSSAGALLILSGAFCALWAQNTGRNPWLWFFLGLIFSCIAVFFVLAKNADDLRTRRGPGDNWRSLQRPGD